MLDQIIEIVVDLRTFIIVSAVIMAVSGIALLVLCRKFSFDGRNIKAVAFFYGMEVWDTVALAVGISKVCLCISFFITGGKVTYGHIGIYVILHLLYIIHRANIRNLPNDMFNGIASCAVMVIMGMLYDYLREVMFDWRIQAIIILMMIIICGYSLCDLFNSCACIINIPKAKENKNEKEIGKE